MLKKLFLSLFLLLFLIILSPVILLALMYQGDIESALPTESYQPDITPSQIVSEEMDQALSLLSSPTEDLGLGFSEGMMNALIYASLTQEEGLNPEYQPGSSCETDACQFLVTESLSDELTAHLKGVWVELEDDQITIHLSAALDWQDRFTYQTILSLVFNVTDDTDAYRLTIDRVRLGRLPVTSRFVGRILGFVETITGQPILEVDGDLPIGTIDTETFSITVSKDEIVRTYKEDESIENGPLVGALLEILFDNELLTFKLEDQMLNFSLRTSLILSDETTQLPSRIEELYENDERLDLEAFLQNRFEEFLLTQALLGDTSFRLNQRVFNTIIASSVSGEDGLPDLSWDYENSEGNDEKIELGIRGIWVTLLEETFTVHALLNIASNPSLIEFNFVTVPSNDPFTLVYEIESMTMGRSPSNPDHPYLVIADFEAFIPLMSEYLDSDFIRFNALNQLEVGGSNLEEFLNDLLAESGILLNEITVVDGAFILGLGFDPQLQLIFDNYASAINDVLGNEDFINALNNALDPNNKEAEELINQLSEIQQKISQNEPVTPEDVNKLVQEFDDLSNEEQDAFFSAMQAFIDPSLVEDFENSFNN